ncbi:DUF2913 family protein [Scandinavium goeteborgense]|uniref:DUF2913 family protein n=1 Tax=Scandinavium goeteborgense TaxID=1851514 RepID=UPI000F684C07|nr:DUF2913 family protein [Scandinavium goeteborgense]QKN79804.1 DUF2913 family protein [Scandinavium goeteborgense]
MTETTLAARTAHMAWCALIALHTALQDGAVASEAQQTLFITRWLAEAKRTRRFPREATRDIDWLLKQGRTLGVRAKLPLKLNFLWDTTTGTLEEQPDLYRLSHALDTAREYHWVYQMLSDEQWQGRRRLTLNPEVNGVYVLKSSLDAAFNEAGTQCAPVRARITGNVSGFLALLESSGWRTEQEDADQYFLNTREPCSLSPSE